LKPQKEEIAAHGKIGSIIKSSEIRLMKKPLILGDEDLEGVIQKLVRTKTKKQKRHATRTGLCCHESRQ